MNAAPNRLAPFTLFAFVLLGFVCLVSCSSSGDTGDDADGDTTADGDETDSDGDDSTTDGDAEDDEGEKEDDTDTFIPPELTCDEPYPIPQGSWSPATSYRDEGFVFKRSVLIEGELSGGVHALVERPAGGLYAAGEGGLFVIEEDNTVRRLSDWPAQALTALFRLDDARLVAASGVNLLIGDEDETPSTLALDAAVTRMGVKSDGVFWVLLENGAVVTVEAGTLQATPWFGPFEGLTLSGLGVVQSGAVLATDQGLRFWSDTEQALSNPWGEVVAWTSALDAASPDGQTVWAATDAGLVLTNINNFSVELLNEGQGLPYRQWRTIAWLSGDKPILLSEKGAFFNLQNDWSTAHLLHSRYYAPSRDVRAALWRSAQGDASGPYGRLFLATSAGVGVVTFAYATLREKAVTLDLGMAERHNRYGQFSRCALAAPGDLSQPVPVDDDNDGQWTNMYLASQAFRWVVTHDEEAKTNAYAAAEGMLRLLTITGKKGFFSRSVVEPERCEAMAQTGGEWHLSEDEQWCWKGDTSADEYVGHVFGLSLFYDLVADEEWKTRIRQAFVDLHDGIIEHGFIIEDIDGKSTTHGHFDPDFMHTVGRFGDAGLYSAMFLGGLRATYHMSGEPRFLEAFYHLAVTENYREYVADIERINLITHINHDAEEMSFLALATLMRYETEPCLLVDWRNGLQQLWDVQRPENNPEFNFIYGWLMRTDTFDADRAVTTLQQLHDHGVHWAVTNSDRDDLQLDPKLDRHGEMQATTVPPFDQKPFPRWSENPYRLDYTYNGMEEEMLIPYLLPYWLGSYMGYLVLPDASKGVTTSSANQGFPEIRNAE